MQNDVFRIGKWIVDPVANTIRASGKTTRLQPRFMRVLTLLREQNGSVVTRDDLIEKTWPNVVVQEAALTQAISHLRTALGPVEGACIETIPKVGYRLRQPVTTVAKHRYRFTTFHGMLVGLGVILLIAIIGSLTQGEPDPPIFRTARLTSTSGLELWPAISLDGASVVFARSSEHYGFDLFTLDVESTEVTQLTSTTTNDVHPVWSPDASHVLFARKGADDCKLVLIAIADATERRIGDCTKGSWPSVAWSPDGLQIAVSDLNPNSSQYEITIRDAVSFEQIAGPFGEDSVGYRRPVFIAHGEVAFVAYEEGYTGSIRRLQLDGERIETMFPFTGPINGLAFRTASNELVVGGRHDGEDDIFITDFNGDGAWQRVGASAPSADGTGTHLVLAQRRGNANIYSVDLTAHYTVRKYEEVIASTQIDRSPRWSNKHDRIGFVSSRSGVEEIWISDFKGNAPIKISEPGIDRVEDFDWSPDDTHMALVASRDGRRVLLATPIAGGDTRQLVSGNLDPRFPSWSADGKAIYFLGGPKSERTIMRVSTNGGEARSAFLPSSTYAEQAQNGTTYFSRADTTGIWTMSDGEPQLIVRNASDAQNWTIAENAIFYLNKSDSGQLLIVSHDLESGEEQIHDRIQSQLLPGRSFDVSPSGTHVLLSVLERSESDIIMLSEMAAH